MAESENAANENRTSFAVTGLPSCHRAFGRKWKRQVSESSRSHDAASRGRYAAVSIGERPGARSASRS